jgi:hypothetical protein
LLYFVPGCLPVRTTVTRKLSVSLCVRAPLDPRKSEAAPEASPQALGYGSVRGGLKRPRRRLIRTVRAAPEAPPRRDEIGWGAPKAVARRARGAA